MDSEAPRYAIYFAPPAETALWRFGSSVLGYDAATGEDTPFLIPPGFVEHEWRDLTAEPRRYGFHATLKAPFRLARGASEQDLTAALARFAKGRAAVLADLSVTALGSFVALAPQGRPPELSDLADAAVDAFEPFRAPLSEAERLRRRPEALSPRQRELLERYGYPHVREQFRFHMTLTGPLGSHADAVATRLRALAASHLAPGPTLVNSIALVRQTPGARFRIVAARELS
jgi:putative phosphonate metabolism protein